MQKRENVVGSKPLNYKKWDDLEYESDEDDCHPNIEIGTWRRLKERMRKEKGIKKKEPYLVDKWNVTTTNKNYHIDPKKPPKTTEEQKKEAAEQEQEQKESSSSTATATATEPSQPTTTDKPTSSTSNDKENKIVKDN